ncbi:rCG63665 [Rattus norvegicus]|uniref:RCG63665 n=1 Tax=Rattus norvegicus TaxID=10116 RepID=A6IWZ6_RAT|nr:rCG63665 [Rattus norvegicus]
MQNPAIRLSRHLCPIQVSMFLE